MEAEPQEVPPRSFETALWEVIDLRNMAKVIDQMRSNANTLEGVLDGLDVEDYEASKGKAILLRKKDEPIKLERRLDEDSPWVEVAVSDEIYPYVVEVTDGYGMNKNYLFVGDKMVYEGDGEAWVLRPDGLSRAKLEDNTGVSESTYDFDEATEYLTRQRAQRAEE